MTLNTWVDRSHHNTAGFCKTKTSNITMSHSLANVPDIVDNAVPMVNPASCGGGGGEENVP